MIRYVLPAAAAIGLATSGAASAQSVPPAMPMAAPSAQFSGPMEPPPGNDYQAAPSAYYDAYGSGTPVAYGVEAPGTPGAYEAETPVALAPVPGAVWIPGHYEWDPASQNYAWLAGQYVIPPRPGARWVEGHWAETPTAWIWVQGHWS